MLRSTNSCQVWVDSLWEIKESNNFFNDRTVGYGYVTKIKPAKKLLEEQKEQLGLKKDEKNIEAQLENLNVNNW